MSYYKILLKDKVIDVIHNPVWVHESKNGMTVRCDASEAIGVISSDNKTIFHIKYRKQFTNGTYDNVVICDISEKEYDELKALIDIDGKVTDTGLIQTVEIKKTIVQKAEIEGDLQEVKDKYIQKLSDDCKDAIYNGADVVLTDQSVKHFKFDYEDQLNLLYIYNQILNGEQTFIYHASGELDKEYSGADMSLIISTLNKHREYNITYFNSLKNWIESMETISDVLSVKYGDEIPAEFCSDVLLNLSK